MIKMSNPVIREAQQEIDYARPLANYTRIHTEDYDFKVEFNDGTTRDYTLDQMLLVKAVNDINKIFDEYNMPQIRAVSTESEILQALDTIFISVINDYNVVYDLGLEYRNICSDVRTSTYRTTITSMAENVPHSIFKYLNHEGYLNDFDYLEQICNGE